MRRFKVSNKRKSARKFNRSAHQTKGMNLKSPSRGGIRL